jgi:hypothetical protein
MNASDEKPAHRSDKTLAQQDEPTTADGATFRQRERLAEMFAQSPLPPGDLMFNLGLYTRSSLLVKFLVLHEIYKRVKEIPGAILEFGVWWGQNLVLLENLRAIHEPFNKQRRIIGFDTFAGYPGGAKREPAEAEDASFYKTTSSYPRYLAELLRVHEGNNAFGHLGGNHELVAGDVTLTVPAYFRAHPETIVALAYFDIGPYEPTIAALRAILPHLVSGSMILFDELTWPGAPGEAIAFKEIFAGIPYAIEKVALYPSKTIVTVK